MAKDKEELKIKICGRISNLINKSTNKLEEALKLLELSDFELINKAENILDQYPELYEFISEIEDFKKLVKENDASERLHSGKLLIQVLYAMINHYHYGEEGWINTKAEWMKFLEDKHIGLNKITLFDDIYVRPSSMGKGWNRPPLEKSIKEQGLDIQKLSDNDLKYLCGVASDIADFSCIGFGIRSYVEAIWKESREELKKRNIEDWCLFDYEEEVK